MSFVFHKITSNKITHYTIFGERHSGTKLTEKIIKNNTQLIYNPQYGWKHGFGFHSTELFLNDYKTLFLCLVRNPYDWLLAFFKEPHHVPKHNLRSIEIFLFNEWYSVYDPVFKIEEILEDRNFITKQRYKNIFELRLYKIYYMRQILSQICPNILIISYEELTRQPEKTITNIKMCLNNSSVTKENIFTIKPHKQYFCDSKTLEKINANIDWRFEHTIGYSNNNKFYVK